MAILAGIALGAQVFKGISGAIQASRGRARLRNLKRPTYKTPDGIERIEDIARMQAGQDMPGFGEAKASVAQSSASAVDLARESGNPLAAISGIQANQDNANRKLAVDNAGFRDSKMEGLKAAMQLKASHEDKEFQMNEFAPYQDNYNEAREMIGAGQTNMYNAIDGAAAIGMTALATGNKAVPSARPMILDPGRSSIPLGFLSSATKSIIPPTLPGSFVSTPGLAGRKIRFGNVF